VNFLDEMERLAKLAKLTVVTSGADWASSVRDGTTWGSHIAAWSPDRALKVLEALRAASKLPAHYECEDGFYACPQAESYFGRHDSLPREKRPCQCPLGPIHAALAALEEPR